MDEAELMLYTGCMCDIKELPLQTEGDRRYHPCTDLLKCHGSAYFSLLPFIAESCIIIIPQSKISNILREMRN